MEEKIIVNKKQVHNLKSDLTIILGYLQMLEKSMGLNITDTSKTTELVNKVKTSIKNMEEHINLIEENAESI